MNTKLILIVAAIVTVAVALIGVAAAQLAQTTFTATPNAQVLPPNEIGNYSTIPPYGKENSSYAGPAYGYGPGCYGYGYGYGAQSQNQWGSGIWGNGYGSRGCW